MDIEKKLRFNIEDKIYSIRQSQVMLDNDLADLYQVEIKVLNQAVKRNIERFPENFRFQLTNEEYESTLRSQNVTLKKTRGQHRKYLPYAFTEQGVAMLSGVLRSETAINVSIQIMNAFVSMRKIISNLEGFSQRIERLEKQNILINDNFEKIFKSLEINSIPNQGIFLMGKFSMHI